MSLRTLPVSISYIITLFFFVTVYDRLIYFTAISEDYHTEEVVQLEFDACQSRMCVEAAYIYSDEKIEERESIILLLVSNNPDFVEVKQKVSVVTIHESGSQSLSKP